MPPLRYFAAGALMFFAIATTAEASSVIFSNFGPGDTFDALNAYGVTSPMFVESDIAEGFSPAATYTLDSVRLAVELIFGFGNELDIALAADDNGHPGATLEAFVLTVGSSPAILTATSVLHPTLNANGLYWLVADVPDVPAEVVGWNFNSIAGIGLMATMPAGGPWFVNTGTQAAFEVNGTRVSDVPEPASLLLMGVGLVGLVRRRFKQ